jgi:HemY protein
LKTLWWLISIIGLAVAFVLVAKYNYGYVLLVYPPYRFDLSLNLFLILVVTGFILTYILVRIAVHALKLPSYVKSFKSERRRAKGRTAMVDALMAFAEERYSKAEKFAEKAIALDEAPGFNTLLAARAAHEMKSYTRRDDYLSRAEKLAPEFPVARLMTQAELLLDERRVQEALSVLKSLRELAPKHTGVLRLELRAQQLVKNWDQVLSVIAQLEKRDAIEAIQAQQLKINAHLENLKRKGQDVEALKEYWGKIPSADRLNGKIALTAARYFLALGGTQVARDILEQSLEKNWDPALVEIYGHCYDKDLIKQIERAENWLKSHPKEPALLLALGRLCARQELWGKAQSYLEASLAVEATSEAHVALAQLLQKMNKVDEACKHYQQSLTMLGE